MSSPDRSVVPLVASRVEPAAEVLARGLQHGPDMLYLFGDPNETVGDAALRLYRAVIRVGLRYGAVYTTTSISGVAVWTSPAVSRFTSGILLRTGLLTALLSMGWKPLHRFAKASSFTERLHAESISQPHWTLVYLAVEPRLRGNGIGGLLIEPILARADAEGLSCYVESADERNLSFYARQGFVVVRHDQVPYGGPSIWTMVRPPSST